MRQVEIVDAHDEGREPLALLERVCEGADQGGFAHALDAVETDHEGTGVAGGLEPGFVGLDLGEDKRDADWGLVVDDSRLEDWDVGGCGHGGGFWTFFFLFCFKSSENGGGVVKKGGKF